MAQISNVNFVTKSAEDLEIANQKPCHMCLKEFTSMPDLHRHIETDHDMKHPTCRTYQKIMGDVDVCNVTK